MANTVVFPFGVLNEIPGVGGVDDVRLTVPGVDDIAGEIEDRLPSASDFRGDLGDALEDTIDIITDEIPGVDEIAEAVNDELDFDLQSLERGIVDDITDALADQELDVSGLALDPDSLADSISTRIDLPEVDQPAVEFESVFGALSEDVADGFEEVLNETVGELSDLPEEFDSLAQGINESLNQLDELEVPSISDIQDGLRDELDGFVEDLPGGDLLADPDSFIDSQIDRVTDGLVDDTVVDSLQDTLEEVA